MAMEIPPEERELKLETWYYETYIPRSFTLDNGEHVELEASEIEEKMSSEPLFLLYIPPDRINDLREALKSRGFYEPVLHVSKGEVYSLVKRLREPWELHVRVYEGGFMEAEVEVSREYVEHLGPYRVYVVYEAFSYYSHVYDKLHVLYKPSRAWVISVKEHFRVRVRPPKLLTPWKPIVASAAAATALGMLAYALSRLERGVE